MGEAKNIYFTCLNNTVFNDWHSIAASQADFIPRLFSSSNMSLSMLNRSIASMAGRSMAGSYDVQEYFWGAKVTKKEPSFKWNPQVEEEFRDEMQNILFLKRAVLGVDAVDGERNIVEVQCKNMEDESEKHPILSLTLGQQDHCDVELTFKQMEEVTFTLIAGSGPVHLVGQHYLETIRESDMDGTDMEEEDEEDEELEAIEEEEAQSQRSRGRRTRGEENEGCESYERIVKRCYEW